MLQVTATILTLIIIKCVFSTHSYKTCPADFIDSFTKHILSAQNVQDLLKSSENAQNNMTTLLTTWNQDASEEFQPIYKNLTNLYKTFTEKYTNENSSSMCKLIHQRRKDYINEVMDNIQNLMTQDTSA